MIDQQTSTKIEILNIHAPIYKNNQFETVVTFVHNI